MDQPDRRRLRRRVRGDGRCGHSEEACCPRQAQPSHELTSAERSSALDSHENLPSKGWSVRHKTAGQWALLLSYEQAQHLTLAAHYYTHLCIGVMSAT